MHTSYCIKKPIMSSIIATICFLFVIVIAGAISVIIGLNSKITLFVAFSILGITFVVYTSKMKYWQYYGFKSLKYLNTKNKILFVPLFSMALFPLIVGLSNDIRIYDYIYIVLFMAIVAFTEEIMFRGVVFRLLQSKSNLTAVLGSSLLFSVPHILNVLNGKDLILTINQIIFALLIGLISAMLILKTHNILPLIMYHFMNNTVNSIISTNVDSRFSISLNFIIFGFGFMYLIYIYTSIGFSLKGTIEVEIPIL